MSGTNEPDPRDRVPVSGGPCAAGRADTTEASLKRNAGGSRTHYKPLCRRPPYRLAPALDAFQRSQKCPRQDSDLVLDLRRVACDPPHSEDVAHLSCEYPAEDSNLVWQLRTLPCVHHTRRAIRRTRIEENEAPDGSPRRLAGSPRAFMSRPGFEPGPGPSEGPMRSVTPSRRCAKIFQKNAEPTAGFAPASSCLQDRRLSVSSHVGTQRFDQARTRGFEPRRAALEAACSPRSTLV